MPASIAALLRTLYLEILLRFVNYIKSPFYIVDSKL